MKTIMIMKNHHNYIDKPNSLLLTGLLSYCYCFSLAIVLVYINIKLASV